MWKTVCWKNCKRIWVKSKGSAKETNLIGIKIIKISIFWFDKPKHGKKKLDEKNVKLRSLTKRHSQLLEKAFVEILNI